MSRSLGGRPKADIWEHVEILGDGKQVKCKYCGFEFAKSANRIKCHVFRIRGGGIRFCHKSLQPNTDSNKTLNSSGNLQENLGDSQGSSILDRSHIGSNKRLESNTSFGILQENISNSQGSPRPEDHIKFNEKMLDCYMSPKTMWAGMTQQQVQMNTETEQQGMKQVGPFFVSNTVDACDLQLIEYVFDPSKEQREIVFRSSNAFLYRNEFTSLKPRSLLESIIIDIFVDYFTNIERQKSSYLNWYLPTPFSTSALTMDVNSFLLLVKDQQMRERYMSKLIDCDKIFIPVHMHKGCGHFYLYVIHLKTKEIEIWDFSPCLTNEEEHRKKTKKLLHALDILLKDDMCDSEWTFSNFHVTIGNDISLQSNRYDCGIFVIKFMQLSANANRNHPPQLFHSDEVRLDLALTLLKMESSGPMHNDICEGFSKDIQTLEFEILEHQNNIGETGVQENLYNFNFSDEEIDLLDSLFDSNSQVGLANDSNSQVSLAEIDVLENLDDSNSHVSFAEDSISQVSLADDSNSQVGLAEETCLVDKYLLEVERHLLRDDSLDLIFAEE